MLKPFSNKRVKIPLPWQNHGNYRVITIYALQYLILYKFFTLHLVLKPPSSWKNCSNLYSRHHLSNTPLPFFSTRLYLRWGLWLPHYLQFPPIYRAFFMRSYIRAKKSLMAISISSNHAYRIDAFINSLHIIPTPLCKPAVSSLS